MLKLWLVSQIIFLYVLASEGNTAEKLLYSLLDNYNRNVVPGWNNSNVEVTLKLTVIRLEIREDSEEGDLFLATVWPQMGWRDPSLIWEKSQFSGISSIAIPAGKIWLPDITIVNDLSPIPMKSKPEQRIWPVLLNNDGRLAWIPQLSLKIPCAFNRYADGELQEEQLCHVRFRSGTYAYNRLELAITDPPVAMKPQSARQHPWNISIFSVKKHKSQTKNLREAPVEISYAFHFNKTYSSSNQELPMLDEENKRKGGFVTAKLFNPSSSKSFSSKHGNIVVPLAFSLTLVLLLQ